MAPSTSLDELFLPESPEDVLELRQLLAQGAFAQVFRAQMKGRSGPVAVKVIEKASMEEEDLEDMYAEIEVMKDFDHKNIIDYYGSFQDSEYIYICMQICACSLDDCYSKSGVALEEKQIKVVMREVLRGLRYMHDKKKIVHRDIKGANVMLMGDGAIKLVDFGTCKKLGKQTKALTFVGTPYWMAPEVIDNKTFESPYDYKADIWSVGIMALELAEAEAPLSDVHPMRAVFLIPMNEPPSLKKPEKWSKEFVNFIDSCLQKDDGLRSTASELLQHPFLKSTPHTSTLAGLQEAMLAKKKKGDDDDDDDEDDEDSGYSSDPPDYYETVIEYSCESDGDSSEEFSSPPPSYHEDIEEEFKDPSPRAHKGSKSGGHSHAFSSRQKPKGTREQHPAASRPKSNRPKGARRTSSMYMTMTAKNTVPPPEKFGPQQRLEKKQKEQVRQLTKQQIREINKLKARFERVMKTQKKKDDEEFGRTDKKKGKQGQKLKLEHQEQQAKLAAKQKKELDQLLERHSKEGRKFEKDQDLKRKELEKEQLLEEKRRIKSTKDALKRERASFQAQIKAQGKLSPMKKSELKKYQAEELAKCDQNLGKKEVEFREKVRLENLHHDGDFLERAHKDRDQFLGMMNEAKSQFLQSNQTQMSELLTSHFEAEVSQEAQQRDELNHMEHSHLEAYQAKQREHQKIQLEFQQKQQTKVMDMEQRHREAVHALLNKRRDRLVKKDISKVKDKSKALELKQSYARSKQKKDEEFKKAQEEGYSSYMEVIERSRKRNFRKMDEALKRGLQALKDSHRSKKKALTSSHNKQREALTKKQTKEQNKLSQERKEKGIALKNMLMKEKYAIDLQSSEKKYAIAIEKAADDGEIKLRLAGKSDKKSVEEYKAKVRTQHAPNLNELKEKNAQKLRAYEEKLSATFSSSTRKTDSPKPKKGKTVANLSAGTRARSSSMDVRGKDLSGRHASSSNVTRPRSASLTHARR